METSSSVRKSGTLETPSWLNTCSSAPAPGMGLPRALVSFSTVARPEVQFWKKRVETRSPGFTRVTPSPTASTTPQPSENGVMVPAMAGPRL